MSEETDAGFQREGDITFATEDTAEETTADSSSDQENQGGDTHSDGGDNSHSEETTPFHKDPRWKEREDDWNRRFNDQEVRHQDDLKAIRDEVSQARRTNAEETQMPPWFGGTKEQWAAYRADRDAELTAMEERAEKRVLDRMQNDRGTEEKAVKEATDFMHSEIAAIEADKALNPTGQKIDPNKLFKVVFENNLVDTQGRWNYRAGAKLLKGEVAAPKPNNQARKEVAASTTSESTPETAPKNYTTSEDFENGEKPW